MLIDFYDKRKLKHPNHSQLQQPFHSWIGNSLAEWWNHSPLTITIQGFCLATQDPDIFSTFTAGELRELFDTQYEEMEKELRVLQHYHLITATDANETRKQYKALYFKDGYAFIKDDILAQAQQKISSDSIYQQISHQNNENYSNYSEDHARKNHSFDPEENTTKKFSLDDADPEDDLASFIRKTPIKSTLPPWAIGISVSQIRNITGYSYHVKMPWHTSPVRVQWQQELIDSQANIIVVDGSRQWGKSLTIAEKVIEESFIPGKDLMICAFLQETTESIGEYMLDFIENFEEGAFTVKERKRYIQNNESGVRIHFRTLKDWAKGIRGKTLRLIVVDEAMLVPTSVFKSVLLPTQTTIENPKLILLWTASDNTSCFMYKTILNIKKGTVYDQPGQNTGRRSAQHIKFSVLENPLVSPVMLQEILADKDSPDTQREYFNKWWKLEDSLFQPKRHSIMDIADELSQQAHIILSIDPARKKDRSGYALLHCLNGKAIILASGEVPPSHKSQWTLQGKFFLDIFKRYVPYKSQSISIDVTWVGDWVVTVFRQQWLKISDEIRYSGGDSESQSEEGRYNVGKSLMINNMIDGFQEDNLMIPYETNSLLLEEMEFVQMSKTRMGQVSFVSEFFDDITNATMIGYYTAIKKRYLNRVAINTEETLTLEKEYEQSYKPRHPRWSRNNTPTWW